MTHQKIKVAIIGSGNIGTDLLIKILRHPDQQMEVAAFVGIDPNSDGLLRAKRMGIHTIANGIEGLVSDPIIHDIGLVFDATSAKAHLINDDMLKSFSHIKVVDLTPAAIGPYVIPSVNLRAHQSSRNINMVTCGGQATIPIVAAVSQVAKVHYGEIIASIASKSAGPGTRANIDEFTETTAKGIESVGGATKGKAIIILNPAEPPLIMRDTVYTLSEVVDTELVKDSVLQMIENVQRYVPGYRLKQEIQFEVIPAKQPVFIEGLGAVSGLKTSVFLEVKGAGHYLPEYAGNLDIMTSAALAAGIELTHKIS